ncbi:MAG: hypothetical protein OXP74_16100 [Acidobacteriota bacterium]|nr:hypothetical protein [Acidobacteriota bacterium]
MRYATTFRAAVVGLLFLTLPTALMAERVRIPAGTTVYCVLDESLSTKKKSSNFVRLGDRVRARVAEDVVIDGRVVIEAGTVVWSEVSKARRAKIAGIRGRLEVDANTVAAVDDTSIRLTGGYDRSGRGRFVTAAVLAKIIAWPFILIKGKQAHLSRGVIFDAQTANPAEVEVVAPLDLPVLRADIPGFEVSIPYDSIDPEVRLAVLPLLFTGLAPDTGEAQVTAVNGQEIDPIEIFVVDRLGEVDFQELAEHFRHGMNRFTVTVDGQSVDVLLEFEF